MKVTDKELLTFCNLTNLKMEYANLKYSVKDKTTDDIISRNHTIYSLLHGDDFKNKEDKNHEKYIKKLINEVFIDTTINEEGTFILEMPEEDAKKSGKKIYKDNLKLLEDAPVIFDYLDNENNNFLKKWEVIYADDNFGITLDFFLNVFNQFYPDKKISSRRELLKKIIAYSSDLKEKKELRDEENLTILGDGTSEILKEEENNLNDDLNNLKDGIWELYKDSLTQLVVTASIIPENNTPENVFKNFKRDELIKILKKLKISIDKNSLKYMETHSEAKFWREFQKILKSLTLKYSKTFKKVSNLFEKAGNLLDILFYINLFEELYISLELINNIKLEKANILHSIGIRKSDLRMLILQNSETFVIVFNDFKEDELIKKIIERGVITEEINQILTIILDNILKGVKVEIKNEEHLTSKNVQALLNELSDIIKEKDVIFTGFGVGGELAFFISNLLEKPNKIFIDDYNNFKTTENIINFNLDDLEMFDNRMNKVSFNTSVIDVGTNKFYKLVFGDTTFFLKSASLAFVSPLALNIIRFSVSARTILGVLKIGSKGLFAGVTVSGYLLCLFKFALIAAAIYGLIFIFEKIRLKKLLEKIKAMGYLKENKGISFVTDEIKINKYKDYELPPLYRFLILFFENNIEIEDEKNIISLKYNQNNILTKIVFIFNNKKFSKCVIKTNVFMYGKEYVAEKEIFDFLSSAKSDGNTFTNDIKEAIAIFKLLEFYYSFQNKALNQENFKLINSDFYYLDVNQENKFIVTKESKFEKILHDENNYHKIFEIDSKVTYQKEKIVINNVKHIKNKKIPFDNEYRFYPFLIGDNLTENINSNYIVTAMAKAVENYNENKSLKTEVDEQIDYTELKFPEKFKLTKEEVKQENIKKYIDKSISKFPYKEEIQEELNLFSDKYFIMETERDENKKLGALKFNEKDKNEPNFCYHPITNFNNNILKLNIPLVEKVEDGSPSQKIVLDGAILRCDKGAEPSKLVVTSQNVLKENGEKVATIEDFKENVNINSFKICNVFSPPQGCNVKIKGPWSGGTTQVSICGKNGLIENCTCECSFGGKIKIEKGIGKTKAK